MASLPRTTRTRTGSILLRIGSFIYFIFPWMTRDGTHHLHPPRLITGIYPDVDVFPDVITRWEIVFNNGETGNGDGDLGARSSSASLEWRMRFVSFYGETDVACHLKTCINNSSLLTSCLKNRICLMSRIPTNRMLRCKRWASGWRRYILTLQAEV